MQNERINFFQKIIMSIRDFDKYLIFATEKASESFKYLFKIMLIFSIIVSMGFIYFFYNIVQNGKKYFNENIKTIEYNDNYLTINDGEPLIIENDKFPIQYIEINTSQVEEDYIYNGKPQLYDTAILVLNDKILIKNPIYNSKVMSFSYEEISNKYNIENFNKEQLINYISEFNKPILYIGVYISLFIYTFLAYTISTLFDIAILTLLGYIIARMAKIRLKINATFGISVHALTLPLVLNLIYIIVNLFTGFTIRYFQWMYTTISYIYIIVAILMIKTDIINTQIELAKIVQEQEKVKQEIEQQDNEDKQEKENKKDKEDEKNTNNQEEPDSSEA